MAAKNKPNEIYISRIYDAPVKTVWDAFTDPKQVAHWWGPRGFTLTTHAKDLKAGGYWDYTMHGPDGKDWPNYTIYHEVEKYSRLVYDHGGTKTTPPMFRMTAEFSEQKGKTHLELTMTFTNEQVAKESAKFIKQAGGNSTWDRLAEYLEKEKSGKEKFVINRSFKAPIETMYEMWTNPKHIAQWMPPTGMDMEFIRADLKPGGSSFYSMAGPGPAGHGMMMYGKANYIEFSKPNRVVYSQQFADKDGNMSRHPMAPTWPETMLTTVTFHSEGPDQTRVTVEWEVFGNATHEEVAAFVKERGGMTMGWTGSFDKLEAYLDRA